ncbi:MAG: redoxin domain-containing protein [Chitinophagales bacterium]
MKKFLPIAIALISTLVSCSMKPHEGLLLRGQIKDEPQGTKVYLEEVTYSERNALDSTVLDAQGNFSIQAKPKDLGLYQLRIEDTRALFFVLNDNPTALTVDADSNSIKNFTYKLSGSPSSEQLRQFIFQTKKYGDAFGMALGEYSQNVNDSTADSVKQIYQSRLILADSNFRVFARGYIDTVKNPIIAIFAISNLDYNHDRATFDKLTDRLKTTYPDLPFAKAYLDMMDAQEQQASQNYYQQKFSDGSPVPDIELNDIDGKPRKLSSLHGNYVLLDFWASWCGPCRAENPNVVSAYQKYSGKGFAIFSVSLDTDKDKWVNAIKKDHLFWPNQVSELKGWQSDVCQEYGIQAIPQNYLLDKDGKVIAYNLRGDELDTKLASLLQ